MPTIYGRLTISRNKNTKLSLYLGLKQHFYRFTTHLFVTICSRTTVKRINLMFLLTPLHTFFLTYC